MAPGASTEAESLAKSLAALKQQRATSRKNITRIKNILDDSTTVWNPIDLECRLDILNSYIKQVMAYQSEIEKIDSEDDKRAELEELCISAKSKLLSLLGNRRRDSSMLETTVNATIAPVTRLPNLKLPNFSGKYADYKNFIGTFTNLVHDEASLSSIEKFNHLLSCLSGEALHTVKAFQVTAENYSKALERLAERYDKKCLIFFDSVEQIFSIPKFSQPNASLLRNAVDTISATYDSLHSLGSDKDITNALFIHLAMSKVDGITRAKWNDQLDYSKLPTWNDCAKVLIRRCQSLEVNDYKNQKPSVKETKASDKRSEKSSFSITEAKVNKCSYCKVKGHLITNCGSFANLTVTDRFNFTKKNALCINCLKTGHSVSTCRAVRCRVCQRPHNSLLHKYQVVSPSLAVNRDTPNASQAASNTASITHQVPTAVSHVSTTEDVVILATALVQIQSQSGEYIVARALLDSGSQVSLISEEMAKILRLKKERKELQISGVGQIEANIKGKVSTSIKSRINEYEANVDFWVIKSISGYQPEGNIATTDWKIPSNIELADPFFFKRQKVDLLIGAEIFFSLLSVGQIKLNTELLTLQKTQLGWIVSGKCKVNPQIKKAVCDLTLATIEDVVEKDNEINETLKKFWEIEEVGGCEQKLTPEHIDCENHFKENLKILPSGRFEVKLPFKKDPSTLGSTYEIAQKRFLSLERRLEKSPEIYNMYKEFMNEYEKLGHMSRVENIDLNAPHYFIPHQCVLRPDSTTTKLRVVFDASCKSSTRVSLNDTLMVGPTIQPEIFIALVRFRCRKYAITADITKMYRQVSITDDDRKFQLILFRESPLESIQKFCLNTVTYGTAPAPFLAIRCLKQLSDMYSDQYPLGCKVIRDEFYVDDMLSGADNVEELQQIQNEVVTILKAGGFSLAKWHSNHPNLFKNDDGEKSLEIDDTPSSTIKALGVTWSPKEDLIKFKIDRSSLTAKATKRNILSVSSRIFDPLGLLCPIIIKVKILLQELWLLKLAWDESIPQSIETSWQKLAEDLAEVNKVEVPRFVNMSPNENIQVHGFCDASQRAYGCCIYIRSSHGNVVTSRLLTAKSKVAPLKTKSLPRLELCAALLLTRLYKIIEPLLKNVVIENINFWSDSEIVLYWLKKHSSALSTFVANRVSEIQENTTNVVWRHVPTKQNPADLASRGCNVDQLIQPLWLKGPNFLVADQASWPVNKKFELTECNAQLELKQVKTVLSVDFKDNIILKIINSFSSFNKIIRIVAYIYKFIKPFTDTKNININAKEYNWAFLKCVEMVQRSELAEVIENLKKGEYPKPNIQKLNPFIQDHKEENRSLSLLRVGGRLKNSEFPEDVKFPLLLPKSSNFVHKYIEHLHKSNCHAGPKILIGLTRQKLWVINIRDVARKVIHECIRCFKYKPKLMTQIMGDLPSDRLRSVRPFLICGVDFCGPVHTTHKIRGRQPYKSYIAIFVCFNSKAVHIEPVSDLSTNAFLSVLKRFIGRRGVPAKLYCDNATNFVGASARLKELSKLIHDDAKREEIHAFAAEKGMHFVFIPPRSPHFGGLWEAAVKSAKFLLMRVIGDTALTFEELGTVLIEVEAILNSRPIAGASDDPNDGEAITPAHMLIGDSLAAMPEVHQSTEKLCCLDRWQRLSYLKARFWSAFQRDYILGLQARTRWNKPHPNLEIGALVLIHDDNLPPQKWLVGRVTNIKPGADGKVRVADVKTKSGVYRRAIHKLAQLPTRTS